MAKGQLRKRPRVLLIYCEGKTEQEYFKILKRVFRPVMNTQVVVSGQKGQHKVLINNVVDKRNEIVQELGFSESEVECWAVCDEDTMPCSYTELRDYAQAYDVHLAFSAPQFEMYLLQHFEPSGECHKDIVFKKLTERRQEYGGEGEYNNSTKSDLEWLHDAIDHRPKLIDIAITNSNQRSSRRKKPFFTVQELTIRIKELSL